MDIYIEIKDFGKTISRVLLGSETEYNGERITYFHTPDILLISIAFAENPHFLIFAKTQ